MRLSIFLLICLLLNSSFSIAAPVSLLPEGTPREMLPGQKVDLKFELPRKHTVALGILFKDADFAGASILVHVNQHDLPPYHAFGGDTRYDGVKGKPGLHPPLARIEANYVLLADWVHQGANVVTLTNAGPGHASVESVVVREVSGHDLPRYENPIYFDFDVWRQGVVLRPGSNAYLDSALLGIIPGGGTHVMNYSGGDGAAVKLAAEDARANWGFGRSTFYSIWHLVTTAKQWCQFLDVDANKATTGKIHSQFANPPDVPSGTDIALIKPDGYLNVLKPGIDGLRAYSSDYNITCEQWGPRGQGFGRWWGDRLAKHGYDARKWADNYQTEFGKLARYIHDNNPSAPVMAPHWWTPDIRFLLYDTSLARGFKMRDMTDAMMTHYYSFPFADFGADGKPFMNDVKASMHRAKPELQYPGGEFEPPDWEKSRPYMSTWALIPEIAIDWNRYRLSRTEKDMKARPGVDPRVNRWSDGKPFNFQAGFDGDERSYNNETCVYDRNYSGPAPYQFLYAMINYSLLPTAASEATEFQITRTQPLVPTAKPVKNLFGEIRQPINRYGQWITGAAGTHRLRTEDPLYGDLFGYTGFEQATTGDYIWLCGIKEGHHRQLGADAWNLVRRTCYAFVTTAPVYPASINDSDTNHLFVKTLVVKQDGRDVIAVYAVNNDTKPHTLDLTLPAPWNRSVPALVFDDRAGDWSDARSEQLQPTGGNLRCKTRLPPVSPWCMFLYPPTGQALSFAAGPPTPQPRAPWGNQNVAANDLTLSWRAESKGHQPSTHFEYQVSHEMLFRPCDIILTQDAAAAKEVKIPKKLQANRRYHWRVRGFDGCGNSSGWSRPQSFWFQAGPGAHPATPPTTEFPGENVIIPGTPMRHDLVPFTSPGNLAHTGMPFSYPNYWEGAAKAVDGQPESHWMPDDIDAGEGRRPVFPAWWAVRFDREETVNEVALLWAEKMPAKDFEVQTWDGKNWRTAQSITANRKQKTDVKLPTPVKTRAVRIHINAPLARTVGLAEVYIH